MTHLLTSAYMAVLLSLCLFFTSCEPRKAVTETSILHILDQTALNEWQRPMKSTAIFQLAGLDKEPANGLKYRFTTINDLSVNPELRIELPPARDALINPIVRQEEIALTRTSLDTVLKQGFTPASREFTATDLYRPLMKLFSELAQDSGRRVVLINSDMIENTPLFSFEKQYQTLVNDPEQVKTILAEMMPVPDLTGIEIIIVYQPTTEINVLFASSADFFREFFEEHGATVRIKAAL